VDRSMAKEIVERVGELPAAQQRLVLDFVRSLTTKMPRGVPAKDLLAFAGVISPEDARAMSDAIEEGCEKVDVNGW